MTIALLRWIDRIAGTLLIIPIWLFSLVFPNAKLEPKRILVVKLWAMGESIITLPMIRAIKKKYPKSSITVLCRKRVKDVYLGNRDVSVLVKEPFAWLSLVTFLRKYDVVVDCEPYLNISALLAWWLGRRRLGFSHGVRSLLYTDRVKYNDEQHIALTYLDLAGPLGIDKSPPERLVPVAVSRADERKIDNLFKESGINKSDLLVCIAPGAAESSRSRIWSAKRFAKLADLLVKEYLAKIIIVGTKGDKAYADDIMGNMHYAYVNAIGATSVKELADLLKRCSLVIGNDSGPMHLSAAMGAPTIGLFCPNTPVRWAPYGPGNEFVYKPMFPKPCINTHKGQLPDCNGHKHMSQITVDDVFQKARRIYARRH